MLISVVFIIKPWPLLLRLVKLAEKGFLHWHPFRAKTNWVVHF